MKRLFTTIVFVMALIYSKGQTQNYYQNNKQESHEILTVQQGGVH
jgi:hypothetical protein